MMPAFCFQWKLLGFKWFRCFFVMEIVGCCTVSGVLYYGNSWSSCMVPGVFFVVEAVGFCMGSGVVC